MIAVVRDALAVFGLYALLGSVYVLWRCRQHGPRRPHRTPQPFGDAMNAKRDDLYPMRDWH